MKTITKHSWIVGLFLSGQGRAVELCPQVPSPILPTKSPGPSLRSAPIVDDSRNMKRFFQKLWDLQTGKRKKVRIGFYGDSNHTMDWSASFLREHLGKQFGYGGHGFVAGSQPWAWYQHREISIKMSKGWKSFAVSTPKHPSKDYGHSGILSFGYRGASVTYRSEDRGSVENRVFDQFEVHYSCRPVRGSLAKGGREAC